MKYADETTWPVNGEGGWACHFGTKEACVIVMEPTSAAAVPKAFFGEKIQGTLVSDDYDVYLGLAKERQSCWAHLLRESKEVAAVTRTRGAIRLRTRLHEIFEDAEIVSTASEALAPKILQREIARIDSDLVSLFTPPILSVRGYKTRRRLGCGRVDSTKSRSSPS